MKWHLMGVDKKSKRIMNLDSISEFREDWYIKFRDWWKWGATKITKNSVFSHSSLTVLRANFEKLYLSQFWSKSPHSCAQIEAPDNFWKN